MEVFMCPELPSLEADTGEKMITWYITDYDRSYPLSSRWFSSHKRIKETKIWCLIKQPPELQNSLVWYIVA